MAARLNRHKYVFDAIISGKGTSVANIGVKTALTIIKDKPPVATAMPLNLNETIVLSLEVAGQGMA